MRIAELSPQMTLAEVGMGLAVASRIELVEEVRARLRSIALGRQSRTASADDVDQILIRLQRNHADLGNAAGAIFRDGNWICTGEWKASIRTSNHARPIRVWRLK